ncbi:MAG: methylmalonyl-CoA mutase family protein [Nitrospirota bacterium]
MCGMKHGGDETDSGIPIDPLYLPSGKYDYLDDIGFPGLFPFTRGIYPAMYRERIWTMRQYSGLASVSESNRRFKNLFAKGQTGLSVAFDLPTQMGYDSDHPVAEGEVGKAGVPIDTQEDMDDLFSDIPLDRVSVSMTINATAAVILAMYLAAAKKRGIPMAKLSGTIQNDILKEYLARGTYIYPIGPSLRLTRDIITFCAVECPRWNYISVSGYHIREAGATAVQELAFTFVNAIAYVEMVSRHGIVVDSLLGRVSFFFSANRDLFEEIAKFRAARRIWARIAKERWKAADEACRLRFHTHTGGSCLTEQQAENNLIRVSIQALAAVLGGTQSLHTCSYDEAYSLPSDESVSIALRTQQIIARESGILNTADPVGGSYFIESLTCKIEEEVFKEIEKIDRMGGAVSAIKSGYMQGEIHRSAYESQKRLEAREDKVVGVNCFEEPSPRRGVKTLSSDSRLGERQIERLRRHKNSRDHLFVAHRLDRLKKALKGDDNLIPYIIECVESSATLGEVSDALREVFGIYKGA